MRSIIMLLLTVGLVGCAGQMSVGYGPAFSAGTVAVDGIRTGLGHGVEIGGTSEKGWGGYLTADFAGYTADMDGGPVAWASVDGRYRWIAGQPEDRLRPYSAVGLGAGTGLGQAMLGNLVASGHVEVGFDTRVVGPVGIGLSARERIALIMDVGSVSVYAEPTNSLQGMARIFILTH